MKKSTLTAFTLARLLLITFLIVGVGVSVATAAGSLDVQFQDNSAAFGADEMWINFDNGGGATPFDVTYNGGTAVVFGGGNHLSNSIQLSTVTDLTFTINSVSSVAVFVSYGTPFSNLSVSPSFFSDSVSGDIVYQNFEITRTGGAGDQGNLTNINYFTAPMSISSYSQGYNAGTTALQSTGFNLSTAQLATKLAASSSGNNAVVIGGTLTRYVGPSTYTADPPYPSFIPYLQSIHASGVTNKIVKSNAFNTDGSNGTNGYNYTFSLNLTSEVGADGTITLNGSIDTTIKNNATGVITSGTSFGSALMPSMVLSGSNSEALNSIIYGQTTGPFPDSVTWGAGWTEFQDYIDDPANNLVNSGAFSTTRALATGEITTAVLMGFLGNTKTVNGIALETMNSEDWWTMDPLHAFSEIQTEHPYYNEWADVIYSASDNGVYGIPYSDRLGSGPLVNSVQFTVGGTTYDVDKWVVGIGDPVSVVPEPSSLALAAVGTFLLAFRRRQAS